MPLARSAGLPYRRTSLVALLVLMVATAFAPPAAAGRDQDSPEARSRELFKQGQSAFEAGNFADAAHLFEQAYAVRRHPALLWNIGRSYQKLYAIRRDPGLLRQAREVLTNYANLTDDPQAREDARKEIANIDLILDALATSRTPPVAATTPAGSAPAPTATPSTTAATGPAPPPANSPPLSLPPLPQLIGPIAVGGAAVLLATTGGALYAVGRSGYDALVPSCTPRCAPAAFDPIAHRLEAGYVLLALGGAAAVADAAWWALLLLRPRQSSRPAVTVLPVPGGLSVSGQW